MDQIILNLSNQLLLDHDNLFVEGKESLIRLEIWNFDHLVHAVENDMIPLAIRNKYVLINLPNNEIPDSIFKVFYEMQLRGYVPIVAQVERNILFRRNPNILYSIVMRGGLVQINASSLAGANGREIQKLSLKLCKHNLVHLVSSDRLYLEKGSQPLRAAYGYLQKKVSVNSVKILRENAIHIMDGTDFRTILPIKIKK